MTSYCNDNEPRNIISSSTSIIKKESMAGGPITCLSLPCREFCLWNQGPFLERTSLWQEEQQQHDDAAAAASAGDIKRRRRERILVFTNTKNHLVESGSSATETIHGLRYLTQPNTSTSSSADTDGDALVFGGRLIAFIGNVLNRNKPMKVLSLQQHDSSSEETAFSSRDNNNCLVLSDWIWDCQFLANNNSNIIINQLVVGLAHNTIQIFRVEWSSANNKLLGDRTLRVTPLESIRGANTSLTDCMNISPTSGRVAAGSVVQEILVWSLPTAITAPTSKTANNAAGTSTSSSKESIKYHRLKGHKGVIHAVQFDESSRGNRLVSASDDRTVRLWTYDLIQDCWTASWTGWGHSARCWHVQFVGGAGGSTDSSRAREKEADKSIFCRVNLVISTGEDGTTRLWAAATGTCLGVLRGHACQSVWRVDTFGLLAVTGGNDGTLALNDLQLCLDDFTAPAGGSAAGGSGGPVSISKCLHLPDGSGLHSPTTDHQVVTDMQFYTTTKPQAATSLPSSTSFLLVATRSGSLIRYDTTTIVTEDQRVEMMNPWYRDSLESEHGIQASDMTCMSVNPSGTFVAIGTTKGDVLFAPLVLLAPSKLDDNVDLGVLPSRQFSCVKRLEWITVSTLLSFHVHSVVLWDFSGKEPCIVDNFECQHLKPGTSGMPKCAAWDHSSRQLVVGDTRGSLSLFALEQMKGEIQGEKVDVAPASGIHRAHGKEHVNDILWMTSHRVFSVGNNGCICECSVHGGRLKLLLSISLSPFTGVERLWTTSHASQSTIVGGYYGNVFALKHFETGYEFFRIDTGGRQRDFCLSIEHLHTSSDCNALVRFALIVNRKGGGHDIQLSCRQAFGLHVNPQCSEVVTQLRESPLCSLGVVGLHGETTFDVCLSVDHLGDSMLVVTGSEDCSSRVSVVCDGSFVSSKQLPSQVSSVRAVCISHRESSERSLLVVGGSRLTLQFFSISKFKSDRDIDVEFLGQGKNPEKSTKIDHRINAVAAVPLYQDGDNHLVTSGDSNGSIYVYRVSESKQGSSFGHLLFRFERPILSVSLTRFTRKLLLLVGTSGGELFMLDVTDVEIDPDCHLCPMILRCKPHTMGTNSISARALQGVENIIRICTGGDDQAVFCCDVKLTTNTSGKPTSATITRSVSVPVASNSAIRGISWLDDVHFCATSYDQRLTILELSYPRLRCLAVALVDVGDVNAIACAYDPSRGNYAIAVAGAGIEVFCLVI